MNRQPREKSQDRRFEKPAKFREEQRWFSSAFLSPRNVRPDSRLESDNMVGFKDLIWNHPSRQILQDYGSTPEELAQLCGQGPDGWLCSSHIVWILDKVNESQNTSLALCISTSTSDELARMMRRRDVSKVERLIFVANVGKNSDNSVYFSTPQRSGSHWVLITVDLLAQPVIMYCDSNGWNYPPDLLQVLSTYTQHFGLPLLREESLHLMHIPIPLGHHHICTACCRNYPVQSRSNVCGIVVVVSSVIAALDQRLFQCLTGPRSGLRMYLHEPTRYERYLRRVVISWFVRRGVDMTTVWQWMHPHPPCDSSDSADFTDHSYSAAAGTKRKGRGTQGTEGRGTPPPQGTRTEDAQRPRKCNAGAKQHQYICPLCNLHLTSRQALHKHKRRFHRTEDNIQTANIPHCFCHLCPAFTCVTIHQLINHYKSKHDMEVNIETKNFHSEEDFFVWKKQTERDSSSQFVRDSGYKKFKEHITSYFYCHRSGEERPEKVDDNQRKRAKKAQGSCKVGYKCTAFMIVRKHSVSGSVTVQYCLKHTGHCLKLGHLSLSDEVRSLIVGKLSQGVEISKILDDIRDNITDVTRDTLVTRKDIQNIKKQYNISGTQKHPDDGVSVDMWVQELASEPGNPITFYKAQGTPHNALKPEDFLLCMQTDFQRNMMRKHASKIICIDSTHKTTQYDFMLTTVLVLDEFEEAVPVAWAVSNREDAELLKIFFKSLKDSCGQDFTTDIFMSDLANNFYNAWCATFPRPTKRLYCSWHVDKCWRKQIHEKIRSADHQCSTYEFLKALQSDTDEANFRRTLQQFLAFLQQTSPTFQDYFSEHFVDDNKIFLWAACFRIGAIANTNMYAEPFHRILKDVYFSRKQNRRVDYLLVILLKIARDKAVEELIKLEKGKVTHRLQEIKTRHKEADNVMGIQRNSDVEAEWSVPSATDKNKVYSVKRVLHEMCTCRLVCDYWHVCIHMYTCTCPDFLTKSVTCKHIHAVHKENQEQAEQPADNDDLGEDNVNLFKALLCKDKPENSANIDRLKLAAMSKASDIMELINRTDDVATVQAVFKRLQDAYSIGCGLQSCSASTFEKKTAYPSNKTFEPQRRLFSTQRKRRKESKLKLKKPDRCDRDKLASDLSENQVAKCAICFCEDDNQNNAQVDWFECASCHCWIHVACEVQFGDNGDLGQCSLCRNKQ